MKKIILTTFVLSIMAFSANAQYLGLKGGLNLSNLNVDDVDSKNMRTGYHFGAYLNVPLSDAFAFQPEVLYSTKGSTLEKNYNFAGIDGTGTAELKIDYIDVPLLGVFRVGDALELHIGPYIGFLANSSYSLEIDGDLDGEYTDDIDSDQLKNLDYGLIGGVALNFAALQVGARYNYGLQKIEDSTTADAIFGDAKNSYFQVFAALRIGNYDN